MPAPRTAPARAPQQEGLGCGVFLVGMLVLAGVLGMVLVFSSGALNGLFSGIFTGAPGRPTQAAAPTSAPTASATPSPTPEVRVAVPDLSGFTGQAAEAALRQLQLVPVRRDESNATVPAGQVIAQEVPPGAQLLPSQPVTYTVSLGPQLVAVLDVRGAPGSLARQQLEATGLAVTVVERASGDVDAGFVISQSPQPGLRLPAGETVQIVVSLGDVVRFPDVIGLDRDDAVRLLNTIPDLQLIFVDAQGPDRLPNFESYRPNEVVSAAIEGGRGLNNGELIPRGSRIILGVRAP
jgi:serine/threonine-protein kinase